MALEDDQHAVEAAHAPPADAPAEAPPAAEAGAPFAVRRDEQRAPARAGLAPRARFAALVLLALLVHATLLALFLLRDARDPVQVASAQETPVEVVVEEPKPEPPPEPLKPPPPKQPEPPKPKEDLSPAFSAPRAANEDPLKTDRLQEKTSVPKAPQPPTEGQKLPKPQVAKPAEAAPPSPANEDAAAKEEDKTKPDAEALDKAKPKVAKQAQTKEAKAAPKQKRAVDLVASLAGSSSLPELSFAKPTPKSKVYGGTEDVRWMSMVEGMLQAQVRQLPRTAHWQTGGQVLVCFHVDVSGRVTVKELCRTSGYPDIDQSAMRALLAAAPFPPPPPGIERGLIWSSVWDGQLPVVHISKR